MIQNRNLSRSARKRLLVAAIEPLQPGFQAAIVLDKENAIRILRIDSEYVVASGANEDETVTVGIVGALTKYLSYAVLDNQAAGTKTSHTVASSDLVAAGTPLIVKKATAAADAGSTAVLAVSVHYEVVDVAQRP